TPGVHEYDRELAAGVFYNRCSPEVAARAAARLRPQSSQPQTATFSLSPERWGAVPKAYVLCRHDRAVPPAEQSLMAGRAPGMRIHELEADHSPFYSDVDGLVGILLAETKRAAAN